jgi:hypothetical protein
VKDIRMDLEQALMRILAALWARIEKAVVNYAFNALEDGAKRLIVKLWEWLVGTQKPATS